MENVNKIKHLGLIPGFMFFLILLILSLNLKYFLDKKGEINIFYYICILLRMSIMEKIKKIIYSIFNFIIVKTNEKFDEIKEPYRTSLYSLLFFLPPIIFTAIYIETNLFIFYWWLIMIVWRYSYIFHISLLNKNAKK